MSTITSEDCGKPAPPNLLQYTLPVLSVTSKELVLELPLGFPLTFTPGKAF